MLMQLQVEGLPPCVLGGVSADFAEVDLSLWPAVQTVGADLLNCQGHRSLMSGFAADFLPGPPRPEGTLKPLRQYSECVPAMSHSRIIRHSHSYC